MESFAREGLSLRKLRSYSNVSQLESKTKAKEPREIYIFWTLRKGLHRYWRLNLLYLRRDLSLFGALALWMLKLLMQLSSRMR
ncbi:hypothetical protein C7E15_10245 [Stenotrophomonas maltophilia]|nr:hypothetical protein C7E15_10245 [Stenotrophomonas maltophilia]